MDIVSAFRDVSTKLDQAQGAAVDFGQGTSERPSGPGYSPCPAPARVARCAAGSVSDPRQQGGQRLVVRCDGGVLLRQEPDLRFELP